MADLKTDFATGDSWTAEVVNEITAAVNAKAARGEKGAKGDKGDRGEPGADLTSEVADLEARVAALEAAAE